MKRMLLLWVVIALGSAGCPRDETPSPSDAPAVQAEQPVSAQPQPRQPDAAPGDAATDGEAPPPLAESDDRDALCARALRCCQAAFATPGLPRIYADRREIACASIESIPDSAGCRMAMTSWRRMVTSAPDASAPPECGR
jgi:hypothetical protein